MLALRGGGGGGFNASVDTHTYGVVEWEVEFGLLVWLETDRNGMEGDEEDVYPYRRNASEGGQARTAREEGGAGGGCGASLSVYYFPDLCAGGSGGARAGEIDDRRAMNSFFFWPA